MQGSTIRGCVLGNNTYVGEGCTLEQTLVLGNDYYTNDKTRAASLEKGESALGIGEDPDLHVTDLGNRSLWEEESICMADSAVLSHAPERRFALLCRSQHGDQGGYSG